MYDLPEIIQVIGQLLKTLLLSDQIGLLWSPSPGGVAVL